MDEPSFRQILPVEPVSNSLGLPTLNMHYCTVVSCNAPWCSAKLLSKPLLFFQCENALQLGWQSLYFLFLLLWLFKGGLQQQLPAFVTIKKTLMGFFLLIELIEML